MNKQKQVDKSHYNFSSYMDKRRWTSLWHQLNEVIAQKPDSILEIGVGSGIFKNAAITFGLKVKTLDIDPELRPDYLASATDIPLPDYSVDVACAFQVLEHLPFDESMRALRELCRISRKSVIISLPDVETSWASTLTIPKFGTLRFVLPRPWFKLQPHKFDGEHHWEISKLGYDRKQVIFEISKAAPGFSLRTYRVHENQYHRFFILERLRNPQ